MMMIRKCARLLQHGHRNPCGSWTGSCRFSFSCSSFFSSSSSSSSSSTTITTTISSSDDLPANLRLAEDLTMYHRETRKVLTEDLPIPSMTVPVIPLDPEKTPLDEGSDDEVTLDERIFGIDIRRDLITFVIRWQRAKRRFGGIKTKSVSEVRGSGRKVRPQKGTGQARAGHSRPPHWRGGGKAHGKKIRDYSFKVNKKERKLALMSAVASRFREGRLTIVDEMVMDEIKTARMARILDSRQWKSVCFIDGLYVNRNFLYSIRNIPYIDVLPAQGANVYDIIRKEHLVISREGLECLMTRFHDKLPCPPNPERQHKKKVAIGKKKARYKKWKASQRKYREYMENMESSEIGYLDVNTRKKKKQFPANLSEILAFKRNIARKKKKKQTYEQRKEALKPLK